MGHKIGLTVTLIWLLAVESFHDYSLLTNQRGIVSSHCCARSFCMHPPHPPRKAFECAKRQLEHAKREFLHAKRRLEHAIQWPAGLVLHQAAKRTFDCSPSWSEKICRYGNNLSNLFAQIGYRASGERPFSSPAS